MVDNVCLCGEVSMMSGSIVGSSENCWSFVAVYDHFMTTLRIPLPKMAIYLEEVFSILQESSICSIGESWRMFSGLEPFTNMLQMVVGTAVICLGHNKDLCSQRSKYKSYGALRGCDLGVRDCLQVYCGK